MMTPDTLTLTCEGHNNLSLSSLKHISWVKSQPKREDTSCVPASEISEAINCPESVSVAS